MKTNQVSRGTDERKNHLEESWNNIWNYCTQLEATYLVNKETLFIPSQENGIVFTQ